ncbi:MAG TPA: dihydroorotate dehydrogenase [Acidobacteriota bacterium]
MSAPDLRVELTGLALRNPIVAASGTFGYGLEFKPYLDLSRLGALVVKGLSLRPTQGNPPPRACETAAGMLNSIGLQNIGARAFIEERLPELKRLGATVIANFWGKTVDEVGATAAVLDSAAALDALELNISCPNIQEGGLEFGTRPAMVEKVVAVARRATSKHLMVKLSPNVGDIGEPARAAEGAGADSLSVANTWLGMAVDVRTRRPKLHTGMGGLSGPAILPLSLRMVYQTVRAVRLPVIGVGGIATLEDALQYLIVGAQAVQIGTASFFEPDVTVRVVEQLEAYARAQGIQKIAELVGSLIEV